MEDMLEVLIVGEMRGILLRQRILAMTSLLSVWKGMYTILNWQKHQDGDQLLRYQRGTLRK